MRMETAIKEGADAHLNDRKRTRADIGERG